MAEQDAEVRCDAKATKTAKATKRKVKKPEAQDQVVPEAAPIAVVGATGVPLKRCVGKRKVEQAQPPRIAEPVVEEKPAVSIDPQEELPTPPPRRPKDPPNSDSKKGRKGKSRTASVSGVKASEDQKEEPKAQSLDKAFAQCETTGEPKKLVKKLKLTSAKSKAAKKSKETGVVPVIEKDDPAALVVDADAQPDRSKKATEGTSQIPIRSMLIQKTGGSAEAQVVHVEPSTRPKWKKKLCQRMGKGGKKLEVGPETKPAEEKTEAKAQTLEACFAGKRKAESVLKASKKGLLRLGFQRTGKESQKAEPRAQKAETVSCSKDENAEEQQEVQDVEVVDLEAKRPRFDWKTGFSKLTVPVPKAPDAPRAEVVPQAETLDTPESSPKGNSKLNKQGSKKDLTFAAKADWCERHAPTIFKHLKPQKAWQDLRDWLKSWRPNRKGREAALVTGACGCGKTAGVRYIVRKWRGQFMEYDLADISGRSFFENLAKKQRNGNQLSEDAMAQVLICNLSEPLTLAQKECLTLAVQASPSPVIFTAAEGILGPKDGVYKMCLEIRISLSETMVAKQIHEISQKEALELPLELCHSISSACPKDLRKALQVAQLLSVLSQSGQACLPQAACAPMTACERLLRQSPAEKEFVLEDAMSLVDLDDEVPTLLRWNLLPALSWAWTARRRAEEMKSLVASVELGPPQSRVETTADNHQSDETADQQEECVEMEDETPKMEVDEEFKDVVQAEEEKEEENPKDDEHMDSEEKPKDEEHKDDEHMDPEDFAEKEVEEVSATVALPAANQQELEDLETCARISSFLALSDVAGHLALQAAEQAGPTSHDLNGTGTAVAAEPLLLALMSREAQSFGASSQTAKKYFQPQKALQDPVCPISMDQVAVLAVQLDVPKAWILDRVYDWIAGSRSGASQRHLKNFRTWLKRQVQWWHLRQGRCHDKQPTAGSEGDPSALASSGEPPGDKVEGLEGDTQDPSSL